jgi:hypothetical protein
MREDSLLEMRRSLCFIVDHLLFLSRLMSVFFPVLDFGVGPLSRTLSEHLNGTTLKASPIKIFDLPDLK